MEKEREDKILEAIVRQRQEAMLELKTIREQNDTIINKLEVHDGRFGRVESVVLENSKDIKEIKKSLDIAITGHEQKIRKIEEKVGI